MGLKMGLKRHCKKASWKHILGFPRCSLTRHKSFVPQEHPIFYVLCAQLISGVFMSLLVKCKELKCAQDHKVGKVAEVGFEPML